MTIKCLGFDGAPFDQRSIQSMGDRFITMLNKLLFSGVYAAGGDTLDFSNSGGSATYPNAIPPGVPGGTTPQGPSFVTAAAMGTVTGYALDGGRYVVVIGTLPTNWKLAIFDKDGTELADGAYPDAILADTVILESKWAR